jgi:hypothetical protein
MVHRQLSHDESLPTPPPQSKPEFDQLGVHIQLLCGAAIMVIISVVHKKNPTPEEVGRVRVYNNWSISCRHSAAGK